MSDTEWTPASSAARAVAARIGAIEPGASGQSKRTRWSPTLVCGAWPLCFTGPWWQVSWPFAGADGEGSSQALGPRRRPGSTGEPCRKTAVAEPSSLFAEGYWNNGRS